MRLSTTIVLLGTLTFSLLTQSIQAQVRGINYNIAPGASYTWFNNRAALDETFMVGGRFGIGFGEFVELRALYYQNLDGSIDFGAFDVDTEQLDNTDVDIARYGAELKLNLSRGSLLPYLLVGGGVQDIGRQGLEEAKNLYGTAGLGLTISANDRFTFSIEGQYLAYRFNAVRNLLDQAERDLNNLDLEDTSFEDLGNFTVGANLAFYLGGRKPGTLSEIDRAYLNAFGNGFKGLRIPLEIDLARVNWNDKLNYRDTWLGGINLGIDIGPYIGLRAYYLQAMNDDEVSFDFDDLAMYGADLRLNLSRNGLGLNPFIILGGGRINVQDGYLGREGTTADSRGFATGGGGLSLNIGRSLRVNGSYKAVITALEDDLGDVSSTDQLVTSNMFTIGLNLSFGKAAEPQQLVEGQIENRLDQQENRYEDRLVQQEEQYLQQLNSQENEYEERLSERERALNEQERRYQARIDSLNKENEREARQLKQRYQARLAELESQLNQAYTEEDIDRAAQLLEEKEVAETIVAEIERREERNQQRQMRNRRTAMDSVRLLLPQPEDDYYFRFGPPHRDMDYRREGRDEFGAPARESLNEQTRRRARTFATRPANRRNGRIQLTVDELIRLMDSRSTDQPRDTEEREVRILVEREEELAGRSEGTAQDRSANDILRRQIDRLSDDIEQLQGSNQAADSLDRAQYENLLQSLQQLKNSLGEVESEVETMPAQNPSQSPSDRRRELEYRAEMRRQFNLLNEQLATQNARLRSLEDEATDDNQLAVNTIVPETNLVVENDNESSILSREELPIETTGTYLSEEEDDSFTSRIKYSGMSGFAGFNLGDDGNNTLNFGLRWHYTLGENERFEFMPEAFFGLGDPANFGLFLNGVLPIKLRNTFFQPYVGTGFGFMQLADNNSPIEDAVEFKPVFNLLIGTYLNVGNGRLYLDFTGRNLFNNNQLVMGYRFSF